MGVSRVWPRLRASYSVARVDDRSAQLTECVLGVNVDPGGPMIVATLIVMLVPHHGRRVATILRMLSPVAA